MQPEARLTRSIRLALESEFGGIWIKIHGHPSQRALVDLIGCVEGQFYALEVKREGPATEKQLAQLAQFAKAGAIVGTVHSKLEAIQLVATGVIE